VLGNCDVESLLRRAKEIPLLYTSTNRKKGEARGIEGLNLTAAASSSSSQPRAKLYNSTGTGWMR